MRALASIITILTLGLLATAGESSQPQSDAEIRQKIIGTWIIYTETKGKTYSAKGTVTYFTNGCYVAKAVVLDGGKTHEERFEGLSHVEACVLTDTVTNSVGMLGGSPRNFELARVIKVDENELILKSAGIRVIEKRSK